MGSSNSTQIASKAEDAQYANDFKRKTASSRPAQYSSDPKGRSKYDHRASNSKFDESDIFGQEDGFCGSVAVVLPIDVSVWDGGEHYRIDGMTGKQEYLGYDADMEMKDAQHIKQKQSELKDGELKDGELKQSEMKQDTIDSKTCHIRYVEDIDEDLDEAIKAMTGGAMNHVDNDTRTTQCQICKAVGHTAKNCPEYTKMHDRPRCLPDHMLPMQAGGKKDDKKKDDKKKKKKKEEEEKKKAVRFPSDSLNKSVSSDGEYKDDSSIAIETTTDIDIADQDDLDTDTGGWSSVNTSLIKKLSRPASKYNNSMTKSEYTNYYDDNSTPMSAHLKAVDKMLSRQANMLDKMDTSEKNVIKSMNRKKSSK